MTATDENPFSGIQASTLRNKKTLVDSRGYTFTIKREGKTVTTWRCSLLNKTITWSVTVKELPTRFVEGHQPHNHPPTTGVKTATLIKADIQEWCKDNPFEAASAIFEKAELKTSTLALPTGPSHPTVTYSASPADEGA